MELIALISGGGLTGVLIALGMLAGAIGAGYIRYLMKTIRAIKGDLLELQETVSSQRQLLQDQESEHRAERRRDADLIAGLQNRIIELLMVISGLREVLSSHGIATDDVDLDLPDK